MTEHTDKALADTLVERLPDYMLRHGDEKGGPYYLYMEAVTARWIVRDPRVAMECLKRIGGPKQIMELMDAAMELWISGPMERAIIQAYLESDSE